MEKSNSLKDLKNLLQGKVPTDKPQPITNISPTKVVSKQLKPVNILPTAGGEADKTIPSGSQSLPADESKAKLQKTVRDQEQKIAVLEGQLTASERDKKKLTIDLEQLNQKLRTTEREIALSIQKAQELRQQRDEWRSEHNHIQGKIEAQARYARDALSKLRHLEIKNAEYQLKLDKADQKIATLKEEIADYVALTEQTTAFSIDHLAVLEWLTADGHFHELNLESPYIAVIGEGPFGKREFDVWLRKKGFKPVNGGDSRASLLLLGRSANEFDIEGHLMEKIGEEIRVFSQELIIASLITCSDPFSRSKAFQNKTLKPFADGHPALSYLRELRLPWPSLEIAQNFEFVYTYDDAVKETPLHAIGYRVGVTAGLSSLKRHELLKDVFNGVYDSHSDWDVESAEYMATWGQPKTRRRLCRMAYHIAAQIANKKRRKNHEQAVEEWRNDLDWMRKNLYKKSFKFEWPSTRV